MKETELLDFVPAIVTLIFVVAAFMGSNVLLKRHYQADPKHRYRLPLINFTVISIGLVLVIMALPLSESTRGQLLSLIGIVISATIALSSTTFVGNAMAGIMLRSVSSFKIGDFIRIEDHFGRVSDIALLHVEIQTIDRDLMTLPNLYVVTHPTKVIHATGTIISAEVTLGYDISRRDAEAALLAAATETGLADPFVLITKLNDFSVVYQINGLLSEVKQVISYRSTLYKQMLDHLHQVGIEIVSPTFMNTRAYPPEQQFIPTAPDTEHVDAQAGKVEEVVFDIAEDAASLEAMRKAREEVLEQIQALEKGQGKDTDGDQGRRLAQLKRRAERMQAAIERREQEQPAS